jgi:hypothetical protein
VAEIPLDLPWRLVYSPAHNQPLDTAAVVAADVHLLLLGGDIRAPVGQEWQLARRAGRRPLLFLKQGISRTAAALDFARFAQSLGRWRPFADSAALRRDVLGLLAKVILERAGVLALSPAELERLRAWQAELAEPAAAGVMHGGTGESSILLTRERYEPRDGVLLRPGDEPAPAGRPEGR